MNATLFDDPSRLGELLELIAATPPQSPEGKCYFNVACIKAHMPALKLMLRCSYWRTDTNPYLYASIDRWAMVRLFLDADMGTAAQRAAILFLAMPELQYDIIERVAPFATTKDLNHALFQAMAIQDRVGALLGLRLGADPGPMDTNRRGQLRGLLGLRGWWDVRRFPPATQERLACIWPMIPRVTNSHLQGALTRATSTQLSKYIQAAL